MKKSFWIYLILIISSFLVEAGTTGSTKSGAITDLNCSIQKTDSTFDADTLTVGNAYVKIPAHKKMKIKIIKVMEDSRCPKNAQCKWAGNAKVEFTYKTKKGKAKKFVLNTNSRFETETKIKNFKIKLLKMSPESEKPLTILLGSYKATLLITELK